jgi:hypothetical protein
MSADLTYSIFEGVLTGSVAGKRFHLTAYSGGGGGSTANRTDPSMNNPYMESLKTKDSKKAGHVHGGPIPPGRYSIYAPAHHAHLGLSARLVHPRLRPMTRDGFFIHGRGPHGSDGCIVPIHKTDFTDLMAALTTSGGGTLFVVETLAGDRFA